MAHGWQLGSLVTSHAVQEYVLGSSDTQICHPRTCTPLFQKQKQNKPGIVSQWGALPRFTWNLAKTSHRRALGKPGPAGESGARGRKLARSEHCGPHGEDLKLPPQQLQHEARGPHTEARPPATHTAVTAL